MSQKISELTTSILGDSDLIPISRSGSNFNLNIKNVLSSYTDGKYPPKMLFCVIQPDSAGTWGLIDDSTHDPFPGIPIISQSSSQVTITYPSVFTKIYSAFATIDEGLTKGGIVCGPSVGLSFASISFQKVQPMGGRITWSSGTTFIWSAGGGNTTLSWSAGTLTVTLPHPAAGAIGVSRMATGYEPRISSAPNGSGALQIQFFNAAGSQVMTPDAQCTCCINISADTSAGIYINPSSITSVKYPSCNTWFALFGE